MAEGGGLKVDRNPLTAGERQGADRQVAGSGEWPYRRHGGTDRRARHPELGDLNVGRQTTVAFKQEASWAVLNRVNDPRPAPADPGAIDAAGTVMVVNRNGHRVQRHQPGHTRNLVAAAVGTASAVQAGLYSAGGQRGPAEMTPAFGNDLAGAGDALRRERATWKQRAHDGQARVGSRAAATLLLGRETHNAGQITTPGGQTRWPPETASSSARDWRPTPTAYRRPVATRCPRAAGPTVKQGWWRIRD